MTARQVVCAAVSALWIIAGAAAAEQPQLVPHRAVYDLALKSAQTRAGISGATGRMVIEVGGSRCQGWTVSFRIVNQFQLSTGESRLVDSRSSSWEAGDGSIMRYSQRQYVDNRLENDVLLTANQGSGQSRGQGTITKPEEERFDLPPGTVFPVTHQNRLLAAAVAGENRDESIVYDGSDGSKSFIAISFIGPRREPAPLAGGVAGSGAAVLADLASWPVTISYYPANDIPQGEETPSHQVSFIMYANGIAGDLSLDYGDFALDGKLANVEVLDRPPCD